MNVFQAPILPAPPLNSAPIPRPPARKTRQRRLVRADILGTGLPARRLLIPVRPAERCLARPARIMPRQRKPVRADILIIVRRGNAPKQRQAQV